MSTTGFPSSKAHEAAALQSQIDDLRRQVTQLQEQLGRLATLSQSIADRGDMLVISHGSRIVVTAPEVDLQAGARASLNLRDGKITLAGPNLDVNSQNVNFTGFTLKVGASTIDIGNAQNFRLAGGSFVFTCSQFHVSAGMVRFDAGMAQTSGLFKCDTLQANSVISASYSPGAGNIW